MELAQTAEMHARKNKNVDDILAASSQWLAIAQIHKMLTEDVEPPRRQTGFTGGVNNERNSTEPDHLLNGNDN